MKISGICLAILICAALLISGVSAKNATTPVKYTVTQVKNQTLPISIHPMVTGSISQGQTVFYSANIASGTSSLTTDLDWGLPSDSLSLTIISPDGTLGPYYDESNGDIDLMITNPGGSLTPGTWEFEIYGAQVTGSIGYSFSLY